VDLDLFHPLVKNADAAAIPAHPDLMAGGIIESCGWGDKKKRILSVIKKKPAGLTRGRQKERCSLVCNLFFW